MDAETRPSPALFGTALFSGNKLLPAARSGFGGASGYAEFACLGYKRGDDRELVIDEPDAESVRKSFEIRASGCSLGAILKWLYKTKSFHQRENSKVGACSSSEIPTTVPFPPCGENCTLVGISSLSAAIRRTRGGWGTGMRGSFTENRF